MTKRKLHIFLLGFFMMPLLVAGQQYMGYRLEAGDVFMIDQSAEQLIVQKMEGATHELTNHLGGVLQFTVLSQSETGYVLGLEFKDFFLKTTSNLQGTVMDVNASKVVEGDVMSQIFNSLLDHELQIEMGSNGKIITVSGGEALIDKMVGAAGFDDEFTVNLMKKSLSKDFSSEGLAKSFEQMTYFYPETTAEKAIGNSWENSYSGKLSANNTFTLERIDDQSTYITGNAAVTMETEESGTTMSLSGTQETAIQANKSNGFVEKIKVSSNVKGISKMTQLGEVEIPTEIKSTITYKRITE